MNNVGIRIIARNSMLGFLKTDVLGYFREVVMPFDIVG